MLLAKDIFPFIDTEFWQSPVAFSPVSAGYLSPAEDYVDHALNLKDLLVKNPISTYYLRVSGWSMRDAGIHEGDLLIVDRSAHPTHNKIAIVEVDSEFTVKRLTKHDGRLFLQPENGRFSALEITEEMDFKIWGVVTWIIHKL